MGTNERPVENFQWVEKHSTTLYQCKQNILSQNFPSRIDKTIQAKNLIDSFQKKFLKIIFIQSNLSNPDCFNKDNTYTDLNLVNTDGITYITVSVTINW